MTFLTSTLKFGLKDASLLLNAHIITKKKPRSANKR